MVILDDFAPVVKWISQRSSEPLLGVRIPPGAFLISLLSLIFGLNLLR